MSHKNYLVNFKESIVKAIKAINECGHQIAFITDDNQAVIGSVSDGDIRRALLKNISLNEEVSKIMNKDFVYVSDSVNRQTIISLMSTKNLRQIPCLDEKMRLLKVFDLEDFIGFQRLENPVIIMAGGLGSRLQPLTQDCPKPMLKVSGKPILETILLQCIEAGFHNFYFSVNYLKDKIIDYFQDGSKWGIKISYILEDDPLGTAGALSNLTVNSNHDVLVLNGDILSRVDFHGLLNFHKESKAKASLCVVEEKVQVPYGVIEIESTNILSISEKPTYSFHVNAGIYLLNPSLLKLLPENDYFDMPDLIKLAIEKKEKVIAFPIHEFWLDIGHHEQYRRANNEWKT